MFDLSKRPGFTPTQTPFPEAWRDILRRRFPAYLRLPEADRTELEQRMQAFLEEKHFEGCAGLELTDEIRVLIAAQACLLLLHRETECYPGLCSILVYPTAYFAVATEQFPGGIVTHTPGQRLGESFQGGTLVLAWDATWAGAADPTDGHNVALHEFAHQLDQRDGLADGAPLLGESDSWLTRLARYRAWAGAFSADYEAHCRNVDKGRKTLLDAYGASHPAEFFAVATECFFENPWSLRRKHPELYEQLRQYYQQDPATWT